MTTDGLSEFGIGVAHGSTLILRGIKRRGRRDIPSQGHSHQHRGLPGTQQQQYDTIGMPCAVEFRRPDDYTMRLRS